MVLISEGEFSRHGLFTTKAPGLILKLTDPAVYETLFILLNWPYLNEDNNSVLKVVSYNMLKKNLSTMWGEATHKTALTKRLLYLQNTKIIDYH